MNFKDNTPIYIQIAERIADEVLAGTLKPNERIPSVREFAVTVEVNANTVVRSYDYLQNNGIIYNKRGLGYFVAADAVKIIKDQRREQLLGEELEQIFSRIATIGITPEHLRDLYAKHLEQRK